MNESQEIFVKITSDLIDKQFNKIFSNFSQALKKQFNKYRISTGRAFKDYLEESIEKYKYTKTIINKYKPVLIENYYVDLDLKLNNNIIKLHSINDLLEINNSVIITGIAGSGKSTLMKYLLLDCIKNEAGIPLFLELRNIKKDIVSHLFEMLKKANFPDDIGLFRNILSSGKFIIFFDGVDEVDPDVRNKVNNEILEMKDKYYQNAYLVTSRPSDEFISWSNFTELKVLPLEKEKAYLLIRKINYDYDIKNKFLSNFNDIYKNYKSFATNPLLLTLIFMTYIEFSTIPSKVSLLYERIFEMLYRRHDATKFGYNRKTFSNLSKDDFKKIFSAFCLGSYLDGKVRFTKDEISDYLKKAKELLETDFDEEAYLKDLTQFICLIIREGFYYEFADRTFQEYFTAYFIVNNNKNNVRKKLIETVFKRVLADRTLDLIYEINENIFEKEFLIPKLKEIRNDTKFDEIQNKEECFRIFVENIGFVYSIITFPILKVHYYKAYLRKGLIELINRLYRKKYLRNDIIKDYYTPYREKYLYENIDFYKSILKKYRKKGIILYNNIQFRNKAKSIRLGINDNLDNYLVFSISKLKKIDFRLYSFCLSCIDNSYTDYLYSMFLLEKIISKYKGNKKVNIIDLFVSKKNIKQ